MDPFVVNQSCVSLVPPLKWHQRRPYLPTSSYSSKSQSIKLSKVVRNLISSTGSTDHGPRPHWLRLLITESSTFGLFLPPTPYPEVSQVKRILSVRVSTQEMTGILNRSGPFPSRKSQSFWVLQFRSLIFLLCLPHTLVSVRDVSVQVVVPDLCQGWVGTPRTRSLVWSFVGHMTYQCPLCTNFRKSFFSPLHQIPINTVLVVLEDFGNLVGVQTMNNWEQGGVRSGHFS